MPKILFCFTSSFPFGLKETFFENELPYLSKGFEKVYILPTFNPSGSVTSRAVPNNVVFFPPIVSQNKLIRTIQGLFNLSPFSTYFKELIDFRIYRKPKVFTKWLNSLLVFRRQFKVVREFLVRNNYSNNDLLFYSYWAEAPIVTTKLLKDYKKAVRMHGGDFYLDRNNGYLPLRQLIYNSATLLLPISKDIIKRLQSDYQISQYKIFLNYLGVTNSYEPDLKAVEADNVIRIVSCGRLVEVKRTHLIVDALASYRGGTVIEWHHFGDGRLMVDIKERIAKVGDNIVPIIHGWTLQKDLIDFYRNTYVHWFVNVSLSEGIPVSIMEAMSFGIPVIATDVGGTSEIVNENTGVLLKADFESEELIESLLKVSGGGYQTKRTEAYKKWRGDFNAELNYENLIKILTLRIQ